MFGVQELFWDITISIISEVDRDWPVLNKRSFIAENDVKRILGRFLQRIFCLKYQSFASQRVTRFRSKDLGRDFQ